MRNIKFLFILFLLTSFSTLLSAQVDNKESSVGQFMRSNERSYVVIAVILTILTGIVLYVVRLDRKISKLEKER